MQLLRVQAWTGILQTSQQHTNFGDKWKGGFTGNYSDVAINKIPSGNDSWLFTVMGAPASFDLMGTPYHHGRRSGSVSSDKLQTRRSW